MQWLGISFPESTLRTLNTSEDALGDSLRICAANLSHILDARVDRTVPLGVNVESVSIRKDEIAASIDLFHALHAIVANHGL